MVQLFKKKKQVLVFPWEVVTFIVLLLVDFLIIFGRWQFWKFGHCVKIFSRIVYMQSLLLSVSSFVTAMSGELCTVCVIEWEYFEEVGALLMDELVVLKIEKKKLVTEITLLAENYYIISSF